MGIGPDIDWGAISFAIAFYKSLGYHYVEVPWMVPTPVAMLTCPDESLLVKLAGANTGLVGSAEQSFLKMDLDGLLPKGMYVACSPCFRVENSDDGWHFPTFMKVELYRTGNVCPEVLYDTVQHAEKFFNDQLNVGFYRRHENLERAITTDGIDLMLNGVEIGSYGIRKLGEIKWIYGTGLAVPRFSQAAKLSQ